MKLSQLMPPLFAVSLLYAALPISPGGPAPKAKGATSWSPVQVEGQYSGPPNDKGAELVLTITAAPGLEFTSNAPNDPSAYPCRLELKAPGIVFGAPRWPQPKVLHLPELGVERSLFGGRFVVTVPVRAKKQFDPNQTVGTFYYQSCQGTICHPPDSVSFEIR